MGEPSPELIAEAVARAFGLGGSVADVQHAFGIGGQSHLPATADAMVVVIGALYRYTDRLFVADFSRRASAGIDAGIRPPDALSARLDAWSARLDWYAMVVHSAVPTDDPAAILWTVTAPLLTGHYMGPDGAGPLAPPGPWGRPPILGGLVPDLRTPFQLAVELNATIEASRSVAMSSSAEAFAGDFADTVRGMVGDIPAAARRVALAVGEVIAAALEGLGRGIGWATIAVFVGALLLWKLG